MSPPSDQDDRGGPPLALRLLLSPTAWSAAIAGLIGWKTGSLWWLFGSFVVIRIGLEVLLDEIL